MIGVVTRATEMEPSECLSEEMTDADVGPMMTAEGVLILKVDARNNRRPLRAIDLNVCRRYSSYRNVERSDACSWEHDRLIYRLGFLHGWRVGVSLPESTVHPTFHVIGW